MKTYEEVWEELEQSNQQFKKARECADILKEAWEEMNKPPTAEEVCEELYKPEKTVKWYYDSKLKQFESELGETIWIDRYGDLVTYCHYPLKTLSLLVRFFEAQE